MCECANVCMCECVHVCMCDEMCECVNVCMCACVNVCMCACVEDNCFQLVLDTLDYCYSQINNLGCQSGFVCDKSQITNPSGGIIPSAAYTYLLHFARLLDSTPVIDKSKNPERPTLL